MLWTCCPDLLPSCIFNTFFFSPQGNLREKYRSLSYTCLIISIGFHLTGIMVPMYWMGKVLCRMVHTRKTIRSPLYHRAQLHKGWHWHWGSWLGISSSSSTSLDLLEPPEGTSPAAAANGTVVACSGQSTQPWVVLLGMQKGREAGKMDEAWEAELGRAPFHFRVR